VIKKAVKKRKQLKQQTVSGGDDAHEWIKIKGAGL
jgi:hypothetical protein